MSSEPKLTFFRQSGWLMFATVASGAFMFAVHFFSKKIPEAEYGFYGTLLAMLNLMTMPTLGLQMVFAQQTAAAITEQQRSQLASTTRAVLLGTFVFWLVAAIAVLTYQQQILSRFKMTDPVALWVTLLIGLAILWAPVFNGVLQGQQNFLWFGWAAILSGLGRLVAVAVIVLVFGGYSTGMITGALIGTVVPLAILMWHSRSVWAGPGSGFTWREWLARIVPLTLGLGCCQFLYSADPLFVQSYFDKEQTPFYIAAGTLSRALVQFTGPLAAVMFPKIVRATARAEKTDVLALALGTTAVLGGLAALGLSVIAPWVLKLVFKKSFIAAVPLLPWFAWSMLPLALTNVLVNNLLARGRFTVVIWLILTSIGYGVSLSLYHETFLTVIRTLGLFNLLALAIAAWFTWGAKPAKEK
jgi:O-antigen/teichoic acid export membrane protein